MSASRSLRGLLPESQRTPTKPAGSPAQRSITLDTGALIAVENRDRRIWATLEPARRDEWQILVPAGALAQVWRDPARPVLLATFLKWHQVLIRPLTADSARGAGILCGRSGTSDVVDASVAWCARQNGGRVMTSDPDDLRRLLLSLTIVAIS